MNDINEDLRDLTKELKLQNEFLSKNRHAFARFGEDIREIQSDVKELSKKIVEIDKILINHGNTNMLVNTAVKIVLSTVLIAILGLIIVKGGVS